MTRQRRVDFLFLFLFLWFRCQIKTWSFFKFYFPNADHVTVSYARSGGPGGQNVNKGMQCFILYVSTILIGDLRHIEDFNWTDS